MIELPGHLRRHVLTAAEACRYLALVGDDAEAEDLARARDTLNQCVREKGLRPMRIGKRYSFTVEELDRWIAVQVESWRDG